MIPAGYREGVAWAKTATEEQLERVGKFAPYSDDENSSLEHLYYLMHPEHDGEWDKASTFWNRFEIDRATNFAHAFVGGAIEGIMYLISEHDALEEQYSEMLDDGDPFWPIGEGWTKGELYALYRVLRDRVERHPSIDEWGHNASDHVHVDETEESEITDLN